MSDELVYIDADGHLLEPPTALVDYAPEGYRDAVWQVHADEDGVEWLTLEDMRMEAAVMALAAAGGFDEEMRVRAHSGALKYRDLPHYCWDARARLRALDDDGIAQSVLYPTMLLTFARCSVFNVSCCDNNSIRYACCSLTEAARIRSCVASNTSALDSFVTPVSPSPGEMAELTTGVAAPAVSIATASRELWLGVVTATSWRASSVAGEVRHPTTMAAKNIHRTGARRAFPPVPVRLPHRDAETGRDRLCRAVGRGCVPEGVWNGETAETGEGRPGVVRLNRLAAV